MAVESIGAKASTRVAKCDFFKLDWQRELSDMPQPILIVGNPPWVTNSTLGTINSKNVPQKSNFQNHRGIDAITGKANFDIAEWMLLQLMGCLDGRQGTLAMLCKTATARKVLKYCWNNAYRISEAAIYLIDAKKHFGAAVDACLLTASFSKGSGPSECQIRTGFSDSTPSSTFGLRDGRLIANLASHDRWRHLFSSSNLKWRSGVKHDCSPVMELRCENGGFHNGLGEVVDIEDRCLFPMYKSTEISKENLRAPSRWMVLPQRNVSEDTSALKEVAPRTWKYLTDHGALLDRRGSSIYSNRARFSIFGVGDYTFSESKVVVSALHKQPRFSAIGTSHGKPIVVDDTCYFLPCDSRAQAEAITDLLNAPVATDALSSFVFRDSKRPITADVLNQLNLSAIAKEAGWSDKAISSLRPRQRGQPQTSLFT